MPDYRALAHNVEKTLDGCLSILTHTGNYIDPVDALVNVRKRGGKEGPSYAAGLQLSACVTILKATDHYREDHSKLLVAQNFVHFPEKEYLNQLLKSVSKKLGEIPLYVASIDGDLGTDFHEKCDDKGPTVTIVEATNGYVVGGYNSESWVTLSASSIVPHPSTTSFLFQLRPKFGQSVLDKGEKVKAAAISNARNGPMFGMMDLLIQPGALTGIVSNFGKSVPGFYKGDTDVIGMFQVKDYVVFQAIAL